MIGWPSESVDQLFPSLTCLYRKEDLLLGESSIKENELEDCIKTWVQRGLLLEVNMAGEKYYARRPSPLSPVTTAGSEPKNGMATPPKRIRTTPRRATPTSEQRQVAALHRKLTDMRDRHRKLKMLAKARTEHRDLDGLIKKWRETCQQALIELQRVLPNSPRSRNLLKSLGVDYENLNLEISSSEEEESAVTTAVEDDSEGAGEEEDPFLLRSNKNRKNFKYYEE